MKNIRKVINSPLDKKEIDESQLAAENGVARAEKKLQRAMKEEPAVRRVVKAAARLADFITPQDREDNARVIREAKQATTRIYSKEKKDLIEVPDHKIRLAATTLELAYDEGTPVKRSVTITSDFRSAEDILEVMRQSPEATRAIRALSGLGIEIEADAETINTMTETVKSEHGSTE